MEAIEVMLEAIQQAGYKPGEQIAIALDPASSEFYDKDGKYVFKKSDKSSEEFGRDGALLGELGAATIPSFRIEDGLAEDDWAGWELLTENWASKIQFVGDDLFVTNVERLAAGHRQRRGKFHPDQG